MALEPLSPELALVDPELGARARAALPVPSMPEPRRPRPGPPAAAPARLPATVVVEARRPYPIWARVTAALWLLVLGILIGGAAIPHAQDRPRILPPDEAICEIPSPATPQPARPTVPGTTR